MWLLTTTNLEYDCLDELQEAMDVHFFDMMELIPPIICADSLMKHCAIVPEALSIWDASFRPTNSPAIWLRSIRGSCQVFPCDLCRADNGVFVQLD